MQKKWITADFHLGDDRMEILGRPFGSADEMVEKLVKLHNSVVKPDDYVIVAGDICYKKTPEFLEVISNFNGIKTLVRGNHDVVFSDKELKKYFEVVVPDGGGIKVSVKDGEDDIECYVTHYPTTGMEDRFNLVGHVHAAWKYQLNSFNIGIDANHFLPVDFDTIPFHLKAITEFYDDDVWVAYNKINEKFRGVRGKHGTYFHLPQ